MEFDWPRCCGAPSSLFSGKFVYPSRSYRVLFVLFHGVLFRVLPPRNSFQLQTGASYE